MDQNIPQEPIQQPEKLPNQSKKFPKYLITILIIAGILVSGYLVLAKKQKRWPFAKKGEEVCIQVITKAKNLKTGEVRDFPTPCDVPEGWQKIKEESIQ